MQELRGFEEKVGDRRPSGDEYATNELGRSWREDREAKRGFADRDPEVLVVGAGQAGLTIAARMGQIGIDALVVEKSTRVGDVWRSRYELITQRDPSWVSDSSDWMLGEAIATMV